MIENLRRHPRIGPQVTQDLYRKAEVLYIRFLVSDFTLLFDIKLQSRIQKQKRPRQLVVDAYSQYCDAPRSWMATSRSSESLKLIALTLIKVRLIAETFLSETEPEGWRRVRGLDLHAISAKLYSRLTALCAKVIEHYNFLLGALLLVDAFGSGRTSLINSFINYIPAATWTAARPRRIRDHRFPNNFLVNAFFGVVYFYYAISRHPKKI